MKHLIFKYVFFATLLVWLNSCSKTSRDETINEYKMEITKKEYDFFILSSEEYRPHKGIEELGDFHVTNDGKILFSGKKYWSENRFFLFNKVEEIVNYDLELSIYFPSRSRKVDEKLVDEINTRFFPSIRNNEIVNLNDALGIISKLLDLDEDSLDFSISSTSTGPSTWVMAVDQGRHEIGPSTSVH